MFHGGISVPQGPDSFARPSALVDAQEGVTVGGGGSHWLMVALQFSGSQMVSTGVLACDTLASLLPLPSLQSHTVPRSLRLQPVLPRRQAALPGPVEDRLD